MATLDCLKRELGQKATATTSSLRQPLSDTEYRAGFDVLLRDSGWVAYQKFIIPQLTQLVTSLSNTHLHISVLEIGPGPKSVFGYLPRNLTEKIKKYTAFEPNTSFAASLEEWFCFTSKKESTLPCLESPPNIHRVPFNPVSNTSSSSATDTSDNDEKFDIILFCHSMYGMKPKHKFIRLALEMLSNQSDGGMVVVFHRDQTLHLDGLICHRTACFPTGVTRVADDDEVLDQFAPFVAGFTTHDTAIRIEWRKVCRALGRREDTHPGHLLFSSPNIMVAFTQHATRLPELTAQVPLKEGDWKIKNWEARRHLPVSIVKPTNITHVQQCIRWALKHGVGLTVVGGGHSGHCLWPYVVAVDMGAFDKIHIVTAGQDGIKSDSDPGSLVVVEVGCKTGDVVRQTMDAGVIVPLGARPSVGAGLWLQGGIGHLGRLHGLACDAIIGAVMVSLDSSQIFCVGCLPTQHQPAGAVRPENEADLLWAIKGAGTNFGIVVSVTFKPYTASFYSIRDWVVPLSDTLEAQLKLRDFDQLVARTLPRTCSADAYLYWDTNQLHLGVTLFETATTRLALETPTPTAVNTVLGPADSFKIVDSLCLFETEMYISRMHGGHGGGKTSSFKRCIFLKCIGELNIVDILVAAVESRPSLLCYLHLLHGGGAIGDVVAEDTAFGCRDWDFACVVTGVWPRDQDATEAAQAAMRWVYDIVTNLLPLSSGAYGADLGPDPRDAALAARAFGPNLPRLARLKYNLDPRNVLAYTYPLPKAPMEPKLIILVTGESCAGKDYCADIWVPMLTVYAHKRITAHAVSISTAIKQAYAAATGADLSRLLKDRAYKEQHRPALTTFFQERKRQLPRMLERHFLDVVYSAVDVDVLLITGMRDEAPVAAMSHLVPDSKLLEIRVDASEEIRLVRRGCHSALNNSENQKGSNDGRLNGRASNHHPNLIFNNDTTGNEAAEEFAKYYLVPLVHEDLQRLASMVRLVPDFPRKGIEFRHVLGISQQPDGLALCTSLLQTHFGGDWAEVGIIACCEAGGFIYAPALAARVGLPIVLIREAGKLPPPTISVVKLPSHISSSVCDDSREKRIEMGRDVMPRGTSVVVVEDVLATGNTLCAVLQLLAEAGISAEDISVMVIAEFPVHCGRALVRRRGFGRVNIRSLLVFGNA